jgi:hypothetical protein
MLVLSRSASQSGSASSVSALAAGDDDNETTEEVVGPAEQESERRERLLEGVVRTGEDYGLGFAAGGKPRPLPEARANGEASFEGVALSAPTVASTRSEARLSGFSQQPAALSGKFQVPLRAAS